MPLTRKLASKTLIKQNTNQDVIGTGTTNLIRDAFIGNSSQTIFTLTTAPLSAVNTQVFISGVYQDKNTYTISGTTLTFTTPPPSGTTIEVISGTNYSIGIPGDGTVTNAKLAVAPANTIKANNTVSPASPTDITIPQLAAMFTAPTITRLTSGSGTYNAPANVKYLKVTLVGGGGASARNNVSSTNGGDTTFGTLTAGGGETPLPGTTTGGIGGTSTIGAGFTGQAFAGGSGGGLVTANSSGGVGGNSIFGGGGASGNGNATNTGTAGAANTGGGGGGAGSNTGTQKGGGAGGAVIAWTVGIPSPTYSYSVGAGGTNAEVNASSGGSGIIIVEEYYQ